MQAHQDLRTGVKRVLGRAGSARPATGMTVLIYHRVGGGSADELDVPVDAFHRHLDLLADHRVVSLDEGLDALEAGDPRPRFVLTFDDGFADVHANAWPLLRERGMPFTVYVASAYVGGEMVWEGATAGDHGRGMDWDQLAELASSPLVTIGNHTHHHVPPQRLDPDELDRCSDVIRDRLGVEPRHFAYPWGIPVPRLEDALGARFRSAVTGRVGRNLPGADPLRLCRVPVRRTDPPAFVAAKLHGRLVPERTYAALTGVAKKVGLRA